MSFLNQLNEEQKKAAEKIEGPILILAGAGSGKTRTVTYKIAHMVEELGISPFNILALTFTNKAAKEMKERVEQLLNSKINDLTVSTFHSFGMKLLKIYSERIGYGKNFNIYDVDDQKSIINKIKKELNVNDDSLTPAKLVNRISKLKEDGITIDKIDRVINPNTYGNKLFINIYTKYDEILKSNNAMDFSDLLLNTKKLLEDKYVLDRIQERYKYIMVDEYQDTNDIQYEIITMIANKYKNICVVGDEDQSIYAFRGANINNILNFERDYKDAYVVKLERNYRSTERILNAANKVIKNNKSSKGKKLWTDGEKGEKIKVYNGNTVYDEADFIVEDIKKKFLQNKNYNDITILYRTNAQSRVLEEKLLNNNIPYKIFGGIQFFQRKEIKDILSYMNLINNHEDNHNFLRIINVPKRSIGDKTIEKIEIFARNKNESLLNSLKYIDEIEGIRPNVRQNLKEFYNLINDLYLDMDNYTIKELFDEVIIKTKYLDSLEDNKEERIKNIEELLNSIKEAEDENPALTLSEYLDNISLSSAVDNVELDENHIKLMTVHSSKGLEFDYVYIAGMEEGLFPSISFDSTEDDLEEERRLCYVAITRAKKELIITHASERMKWAVKELNIKPSRFISEMDQDSLEYLSTKSRVYSESLNINKNSIKKIENFNPFSLKNGIINIKGNSEKNNSKYKIGDIVNHIKFGKGKIIGVDSKSLTIDFIAGEKKLALVLADKFLK